MAEINTVQPQTFVVLPKSDLDNITASLNEVKELIKGKAAQEANSEWVESNEARKLLGISPKTWQSYRDTRQIPFSQFGRKIYVKRADIEAFLQGHVIRKSSEKH